MKTTSKLIPSVLTSARSKIKYELLGEKVPNMTSRLNMLRFVDAIGTNVPSFTSICPQKHIRRNYTSKTEFQRKINIENCRYF